uniref:Putative secreted protein n=1 Tax=Ixodes ricinus TaxID=34613 RepID=A0A6B0U5L5_IXORI
MNQLALAGGKSAALQLLALQVKTARCQDDAIVEADQQRRVLCAGLFTLLTAGPTTHELAGWLCPIGVPPFSCAADCIFAWWRTAAQA